MPTRFLHWPGSIVFALFLTACAAGGSGGEEARDEPPTPESNYDGARWLEEKSGSYDLALLLTLYRSAAEAGHQPACVRLGEIYLDGILVPRDDVEAVRWLTLAAAGGDAKSQYNLGCEHYFGRGVPQDAAAAAVQWRLAAEQGYAAARENLGTLYFFGSGVPEDRVEAARWFRLAAESGSAEGQQKLALMTQQGWGTTPADPKESLRWMYAAAMQGNESALDDLADYAVQGVGMDPDPIAGARWYWMSAQKGRTAAAEKFIELDRSLRAEAERGELRGMRYLALALREGLGVTPDAAASFHWTSEAAAKDDLEALFELARCYAEGFGVEKDAQRAADACGRAANLGHAAAQYESGLLIENLDERNEANRARALAFFRRAADQGHEGAQARVAMEPLFVNAFFGRAEDQRKLGIGYLRGLKPLDFASARHWLELAHRQHDPDASFELGQLLLAGGETCTLLGRTTHEPDLRAGLEALREAAHYESIAAYSLLARLMADPESSAYNLDEAVRWVNLAVAGGDSSSVGSVQAEVNRVKREADWADRAEAAESHAAWLEEQATSRESDPFPELPCGFCGGSGLLLQTLGHWINHHYWPDTYTTCLDCNGTGRLYH